MSLPLRHCATLHEPALFQLVFLPCDCFEQAGTVHCKVLHAYSSIGQAQRLRQL